MGTFFVGRSRGRRMGLVIIPAENPRALYGHPPMFRNHQFNAAEHRVGLNHDLIPLGVGLAQIDLDAAEHRRQVPSFESLRIEAPVDAAEDGGLIERVGAAGWAGRPGAEPASRNAWTSW